MFRKGRTDLRFEEVDLLAAQLIFANCERGCEHQEGTGGSQVH
jgi:hypothetical protein